MRNEGTTVLGYLPARDLGDGHIEAWEQTGSGTLPLWASADDCRATMRRWGADLAEWRVFALVEQPGGEPR